MADQKIEERHHDYYAGHRLQYDDTARNAAAGGLMIPDTKTALRLRDDAIRAGLAPYCVQYPLGTDIPATFLIAGMRLEQAAVDRITVLARPAKVGRFECVVPTKFTA